MFNIEKHASLFLEQTQRLKMKKILSSNSLAAILSV
jgi:hypothetical protein